MCFLPILQLLVSSVSLRKFNSNPLARTQLARQPRQTGVWWWRRKEMRIKVFTLNAQSSSTPSTSGFSASERERRKYSAKFSGSSNRQAGRRLCVALPPSYSSALIACIVANVAQNRALNKIIRPPPFTAVLFNKPSKSRHMRINSKGKVQVPARWSTNGMEEEASRNGKCNGNTQKWRIVWKELVNFRH